MARRAGRFGRVYFEVATGSASPLPFVATWAFNANTDKFDVTSLEDSSKVYVAGLPDASGTFAGFYDTATAQTYTAASDGVARKFYLYPDLAAVGTYWFGTVFADFNTEGGVGGAVSMSAAWSAATAIQKVG